MNPGDTVRTISRMIFPTDRWVMRILEPTEDMTVIADHGETVTVSVNHTRFTLYKKFLKEVEEPCSVTE